jgi:hypothetical protein
VKGTNLIFCAIGITTYSVKEGNAIGDEEGGDIAWVKGSEGWCIGGIGDEWELVEEVLDGCWESRPPACLARWCR